MRRAVREALRAAAPYGAVIGREVVRGARRAGAEPRLSPRWLVSARRIHVELLPEDVLRRPGLLLDVGAHKGDWTHAALTVAPGRSAIAIEASPQAAEALRARFAGDARVAVVAHAVGAAAGTATMHTFNQTNFNSLLPAVAGLPARYDGLERGPVIEVPVETLDDVCPQQPVAVLKLDVQGLEEQVIAGGRETLARTRALMIEVNFTSHYEGDRLFPQLHDLLADVGFSLHGIAPGYRDDRGRMLWTDAVYANDRYNG